MLALQQLDPAVQAFIFIVAFAAFLVAAFWLAAARRVNLIAMGLALVTLVWALDALAKA